MNTRILRQPQLRERGIDYTPKHLRFLEAQGRFPRRIQLGPNSVGWIDDEIEAWIIARIRASRPEVGAAPVAAAEARTAAMLAGSEAVQPGVCTASPPLAGSDQRRSQKKRGEPSGSAAAL
jgi:prophage regulatory protein